MSTIFFSWTFAVDPHAPTPAPGDIDALIQQVSGDCLGVSIESRGDWFAWTLARAARGAGTSALDFFEGGVGETRVASEAGYPWGVTILQPPAIASASAAVRALRSRGREHAEALVPLFQGGRWGDAEIRRLLAEPDVDRDDEGIGPGYFMSRLAALDAVLADAQAQGQAIAHVRLLVE